MFKGNNGMVKAVCKSSMLVGARVKGSKMYSNLVSMSKIISRGLKVHLKPLKCVVRARNHEMLAVALLESN